MVLNCKLIVILAIVGRIQDLCSFFSIHDTSGINKRGLFYAMLKKQGKFISITGNKACQVDLLDAI